MPEVEWGLGAFLKAITRAKKSHQPIAIKSPQDFRLLLVTKVRPLR